jgi:hypothetical protein
MSFIHDSAPTHMFKMCTCGVMAKCNAQKTCRSCNKEFISATPSSEDGRGRITKRCGSCQTMAPSNRTAVCVCGVRFPTRPRAPRAHRQIVEVSQGNQMHFQSSAQDVENILMREHLLFDNSNNMEDLVVPEDGLVDFCEFENFFNVPVVHASHSFQLHEAISV